MRIHEISNKFGSKLWNPNKISQNRKDSTVYAAWKAVVNLWTYEGFTRKAQNQEIGPKLFEICKRKEIKIRNDSVDAWSFQPRIHG